MQYVPLMGLGALCLASLSIPAAAQDSPAEAENLATSYGLTQEDAAEVLAALAKAQADLRNGHKPAFPFTLTAGTSILDDAVDLSPLEAFLSLDPDTIWKVERNDSINTVLRVYELSTTVRPETSRYWSVTVWINVSGDIERIDMLHEIPAPF